jgi:hypothetical protein
VLVEVGIWSPLIWKTLLSLMLSQARFAQLGKIKGATPWFATSYCFARIVIPTHQVGLVSTVQ